MIDDEDLVVAEVQEFSRLGGKTLVDVTLDEIGRNPGALARIASASGLNVVMGCGWYRDFAYPAAVTEKDSNELADILVREIEVGDGDSGIRECRRN